MVCRIAENEPLRALRAELGLELVCHGRRDDCLHGYPVAEAGALGAPGAALGYCQALFERRGTPEQHTERVAALLQEIGAPWAESHELYWGHRGSLKAAEYVDAAIRPLSGNGRVPILITGLDPLHDRPVVDEILAAEPPIAPGETVLMRLVLKGEDSLAATAELMRRLYGAALAQRRMPSWWPLVQGELTSEGWSRFRETCGKLWGLVNVAVNPFVGDEEFEVVREQVTVAQVPVGGLNCVAADGTVQLPVEMAVARPRGRTEYSLPGYFERLSQLPSVPTIIVLGPTLPGWDDGVNQLRIAGLLPHLRRTVDALWGGVASEDREWIWGLRA